MGFAFAIEDGQAYASGITFPKAPLANKIRNGGGGECRTPRGEAANPSLARPAPHFVSWRPYKLAWLTFSKR